jgi:two-component system, NtrC family, sensor kinase
MELSHHRKAIDEFLAERTMNLKLLASNLGLEYLTAPGNLEKAFSSLQGEIPCFTDLGIIDDQGRHLAYVGPMTCFQRTTVKPPGSRRLKEREVYISDVFLGFRNEPHFIIAVKQDDGPGVSGSSGPRGHGLFREPGEGHLERAARGCVHCQRDGYFQAAPRSVGRIMEQGELRIPEVLRGHEARNTKQEIVAMTWLNKVPWVCVARFDRKRDLQGPSQYEDCGRRRALGLGALIIVLTVLLTTNYLFTRLETKRRSIRFLDQQLRHSSRMASSMKTRPRALSAKSRTPSRTSTLSWTGSKNSLAGTFPKSPTAKELRESFKQVKDEVARTRKSTERFFKATRPSMPVIEDVRVNDILDEIVELLDREFHFNRITVKRSYAEPPPVIRSDPSQLRQVFQNLILNAVTAVGKDGEITLQVRPEAEGVSVTVSDTRVPAYRKDMQAKIFDPLFTTKPDGTGLGLAVSAGIVEKLGGRISVKSEPGKGATFTVELPSRMRS